jgi:hypothetical protein
LRAPLSCGFDDGKADFAIDFLLNASAHVGAAPVNHCRSDLNVAIGALPRQPRADSDAQLVGIGWLLFRVDNSLYQRWSRRAQRRPDRGPHFLGPLAATPFSAACSSKGDEVDRREIAAKRRIAELNLLELDLSKTVILEDDDLDRQVVLRSGLCRFDTRQRTYQELDRQLS